MVCRAPEQTLHHFLLLFALLAVPSPSLATAAATSFKKIQDIEFKTYIGTEKAKYDLALKDLPSQIEDIIKYSDIIFSSDEMALLSGIISFWFGRRNWQKK